MHTLYEIENLVNSCRFSSKKSKGKHVRSSFYRMIYASLIVFLCCLTYSTEVLAQAGDPSGSGIEPTVFPGNPNCQDAYGSGTFGVKIEDNYNRTFTFDCSANDVECTGPNTQPSNLDASISVSTSDNVYFNWSLESGCVNIIGVIVKGGPNANVYNYYPVNNLTSDTDLHAPINNSGNPAEISHIEFCYEDAEPPMLTCPTTDLTLECSDDFPTVIAAWLDSYSVDQPATVTTDPADVDAIIAALVPGESLEVTFTASNDCGTGMCTANIIAPVCFECPDLSNETADYSDCIGDAGRSLSVEVSNADVDIVFVLFNSQQADPYTGGTQIGTAVTPSGNPLTATSTTTVGGLTAGTYYAYAILDVNDSDLTDPDCRPSAEIVITIDAEPNAGDDNSTTVCVGDVVDLSGLVSVMGGTFSDPDATGGLSGSNFNTTGLAAGDYTINYTVASGNTCPDDIAVLTITVDAEPDAGDDNSTTVCVGTTVDLNTLVSVGGGTFSDPNATGGLSGSDFNTTGLAAGDYTINYTVASGNTCPDDVAVLTITVDAEPDAGDDNSKTVCVGTTVDLNTLECLAIRMQQALVVA